MQFGCQIPLIWYQNVDVIHKEALGRKTGLTEYVKTYDGRSTNLSECSSPTSFCHAKIHAGLKVTILTTAKEIGANIVQTSTV